MARDVIEDDVPFILVKECLNPVVANVENDGAAGSGGRGFRIPKMVKELGLYIAGAKRPCWERCERKVTVLIALLLGFLWSRLVASTLSNLLLYQPVRLYVRQETCDTGCLSCSVEVHGMNRGLVRRTIRYQRNSNKDEGKEHN